MQRVIVSVLASTIVLVGVAILVLFLMGYRLDSGSGKLEQGALLQFDSRPSGAKVFIDGEETSGRTATKRTVIAGMHEFTVKRDGYEPWTKTLDVKAGTLTWLDYIRLVPTDRSTTDVAQYSSVVGALASPDQQSYIIQESTEKPIFQLLDIRSDDVKSSTLTLPSTLYSEAEMPDVTHEFHVREWDQSGRFVLVTHQFKGQTEWLVVDTHDAAASSNISRMLGVGFTQVLFIGTDGKALYGIASDGVLRKLDLGAATLSRSLVTHVESITINHDTKVVNYIGIDPANAQQRVAGVYRDGDATGHIIRRAALGRALSIASGRYHGNDYLAIGEEASVSIVKGSFPAANEESASSFDAYETLMLGDQVKSISFSENADYIVVQTASSLNAFEIEHKRETKAALTEGTKTLQWLDAAHLWTDSARTLRMTDFDGTNAYEIMNVAEGFGVTLSENGRYMYAIGARDNGYALQRVTMIRP